MWSYAAIPLIYIFMVLIRTGCIALFNLTVFKWVKERECGSVAAWQCGAASQGCMGTARTPPPHSYTQPTHLPTLECRCRCPTLLLLLQGWGGRRLCSPGGAGCAAPSASS